MRFLKAIFPVLPLLCEIGSHCTTSVIVSYQRFISALKDIAHKMPAPSFHRLPANEAKVIYVTNTLKRKILDK